MASEGAGKLKTCGSSKSQGCQETGVSWLKGCEKEQEDVRKTSNLKCAAMCTTAVSEFGSRREEEGSEWEKRRERQSCGSRAAEGEGIKR